MHPLSLSAGRPLSVLAIGAHPDDIELGCGGTLLRLIGDGRVREVVWVILTGSAERAAEARTAASALLAGVERQEVVIKEFRDAFLPYEGGHVKEFFEELSDRVAPDLILTHRRHDLHQDHRLCSELTWNSFRDHLILEYEIPKYDGDLRSPNVFVALDEETARRKVDLIMSSFPSQAMRRWFSASTLWAILRLRGVEAGGDVEFAEGFTVRKLAVVP
jgi:LmbE family N-acetylglucosaminyl deacetylase